MAEIISKWRIKESINVKRVIIALHGKGSEAELMEQFCSLMAIPDTLIISLEANHYSWYHSPKNSYDQEAALASIPYAINEIKDAINKVKTAWKLNDNQIILVGQSQGAVLSLLLGMEYDFLAALILAGCLLEPNKTLPCNTTTKFFLQHNYDDDCFDFYERFEPTKKALDNNNYDVSYFIRNIGGHNSFVWSVVDGAREFLNNIIE